MMNFGPRAAENGSLVWGTPANFNGFRVFAALLHGHLVVGVSQTLRRSTEGATYIRQGGHHVGHLGIGPHSNLPLIVVRQLLASYTANYFCNLVVDIYLFTTWVITAKSFERLGSSPLFVFFYLSLHYSDVILHCVDMINWFVSLRSIKFLLIWFDLKMRKADMIRVDMIDSGRVRWRHFGVLHSIACCSWLLNG